MKNTKRRIEPLSFYDHNGISSHLEKMAAKGWMIEKIVNTGWVYKRIEPQEVHFAVSYYPKASEFDPEPSEEQKMFHDFCAHTGWQLACTSAQMQIFYNERENPVPIETEPELEVQSIHASAKKSFIPSYILLLVIAFLQGSLWVGNLRGDPLDLLSNPTKLFTGFCWLVLAILCAVEIGCYLRWHAKAEIAAKHGEFLKTPSTSKFQKIVLAVVLGGAGLWGLNYMIVGDNLQRLVVFAMCIYMFALFGIVNATKEFLKRKKASRGINRTLTVITSFVASFAMMGAIVFGTLYASSHGVFADKDEETYVHNGATWVIHQDELPLVVEDLVDVDYNGYIKERRGNESLILGQLVMRQHPRFDAKNYSDIPQLEYTMTIVKVPALYEMCKKRLIYEREELHYYGEEEYRAEDAAPWGANEVYRLYDLEYGVENDYLLCYDNLLVEINFDWEPTIEQMAIVGEKLKN
ncbi:MAG: DUF2812 domain-containing protein [Lachnospiraceae bacterium]|nr:DUF2812 domain-containing protein [Lachnospiraceae bacterium]